MNRLTIDASDPVAAAYRDGAIDAQQAGLLDAPLDGCATGEDVFARARAEDDPAVALALWRFAAWITSHGRVQ